MSLNQITSEDEYQSAVHGHQSAIIVFGAEWSDVWRAGRDVLKRVGANYPNVYLGFVDIDQSPELSAQHGINQIPNLFGYKGGKEATRWIGPIFDANAHTLFKQVS